MAKMTISNLQKFVKNYVAAAKQAGAWNATTDNFIDLIDKIGKMVTLSGDFNDKLPELMGDDLPLGKTIEEYLIDLTMPTDYDPTGANVLAPADPSVEDVAYSYTLGRKKIKTTLRYDNFERACLNETSVADVSSQIMQRLTDSRSLYIYNIKKQLLANFITKAVASNRSTIVALPTDTTSAENFIKQVKNDVESASFASENTSLSGALIGAAPELILYVKKGVMSSVEVDAMAGAFHDDRIAIPARVKVVDDFGNADDSVFAMLIDPRGVKLHTGYHAIRTDENGDGDFVNFIDHSEFTGFISKYTYINVYKTV